MIRLLSLLVLPALAGNLAFAQDRPVPILPDGIQWQSSPAMAGAQSAWVLGGAQTAGIYAQRVRLAQGAMIPPHTHNDERFSVVLSGTIHVGFGEVFDEHAVVAIPAGGLYVAPAGVPHYVWARDGAAEYQESGMGPTGTTFVAGGN
jgi:quercetin dioxygenase-like cupin family protein